MVDFWQLQPPSYVPTMLSVTLYLAMRVSN